MPDPITPRQRPRYLPGTSLLVFPRRDGLPEDFSPYWPHGLDFSRNAGLGDDRPPAPPADMDQSLPARAPAAPMQPAAPAVAGIGAPPAGSSAWASMNRETPDVRMDARLRLQPLDDGRQTPDDARGGPQLYDAEVPAFQRDLQSDSSDTQPNDPRLNRVGFKHVIEGSEGLYDIFSKARTAKDVFDAGVAIGEGVDDDDVSSNSHMLGGGKWWMTDVLRDHRPGSEFAQIIVTDDGFLLTGDRGFTLGDKFTRQPAPVSVRTELNDEWNSLDALVLARDQLIRERSGWGKAGEVVADVLTGLPFPGASGAINDLAQWAGGTVGRTGKYPGFTAEQSQLVRQAAIEARIAQLKHRQGR